MADKNKTSVPVSNDTASSCDCNECNEQNEVETIKLKFLAGNWFTAAQQFANDFIAYRLGNKNDRVKVEIDILSVGFGALYGDIVNEAESRIGLYDGFITPPGISGSIVDYDGWADLTPFIQDSTAQLNDWNDIMIGYRKYIAQYEGKIIMYPVDGDSLSLYYRKDILQHFNLAVPRTWEEYNHVAKTTHGKMYNGTKLVGSCIGRVKGCAGSYWANLLLSSMTQTSGQRSGHLFDTETMKPLTGEALEYALEMLEEQVRYGHPEEFEGCANINTDGMSSGNCVLSYFWGDIFKRYLASSELSETNSFEDNQASITTRRQRSLGVAPTPGFTRVLDRETMKLVPCDAERCKYTRNYDDIGLVNTAPYLAFGGWSCAVNNYTGTTKKQLAIEFCAYMASRSKSIEGVIPNATSLNSKMTSNDPFRKSHLNIIQYVEQGFEKGTAVEYIETMKANLESDNVVTDIRFPESTKINAALDAEFHAYLNGTLHGDLTPEERRIKRQQVVSSITKQWLDIINIYNNQGNTEVPLLESYQRLRGVYAPDVNLNQLDGIRIYVYIVTALIFLFSIAFGIWTHCHRKSRVVRASQPFFLLLICFGTFILGFTLIPLSIDDSVVSPEACNIACMSSPWLLALGFTVIFSAMFSKIWRIRQIIKNSKKFKRVKITEVDVLKPFGVLLTLNIALLLTWTLTNPLRWVRTTIDNTDGLSSFGACRSEGHLWKPLFGLLVSLNLLVIIFANVEAYKGRNLDSEYHESKYIGMTMASIMQVGFVGVPLLFLVYENPSAQLFVWCCIICVVCLSVLLLIFLPKMIALHKNDPGQSTIRSTHSVKTSEWQSANIQVSNQNYSMQNQYKFNRSSQEVMSRPKTSDHENPTSMRSSTISNNRIIGLQSNSMQVSNQNSSMEYQNELNQLRQKVSHLQYIMEKKGIDAPSVLKDAGLSKIAAASSNNTSKKFSFKDSDQMIGNSRMPSCCEDEFTCASF